MTQWAVFSSAPHCSHPSCGPTTTSERATVYYAVKMPRFPLKTALLFSLLAPSASWAGPSPWWEHYERSDNYRCGEDVKVLIERNDSQASLYMRGYRLNLFRDQQTPLLKRYANSQLSVTFRGDEIELEDLTSRRLCQRFEQA